MSGRRRIMGGAVVLAKVLGLLLVAVAILGLPQMRSITGRFAPTLEVLPRVGLGLVGIAWLAGVEIVPAVLRPVPLAQLMTKRVQDENV